jgi:hypothetical protein
MSLSAKSRDVRSTDTRIVITAEPTIAGRALTAVASGITVLAVAAAAFAERLPIRTDTVADGLAHNAVNRIVPDARGFLWFCSRLVS